MKEEIIKKINQLLVIGSSLELEDIKEDEGVLNFEFSVTQPRRFKVNLKFSDQPQMVFQSVKYAEEDFSLDYEYEVVLVTFDFELKNLEEDFFRLQEKFILSLNVLDF